MSISLGNSLSKGGTTGPTIVTDGLVLKHKYDAGGVVPVSDGAMYLNGSDAELTITDDSSLDFATGDFSICFWVNLLDVSANASKKILIKKGSDSVSANTGFTLQFHSNGTTLRSTFYDGDSGAHLEIANVFSNNDDYQWHHYAITFDRNVAMYAYKDGVLIGSDTDLASHVDSISNSDNIVIGKYSTNYLTGYMCNFGIFTSALTQAQIKSIMWKNYAGLTSSETTNLVSWWNLDSAVAPDYTAGPAESAHELAEPSNMTGLILDEHDTTFTELSVTNGDFTSGSGTTITGWTNTNSQWTRVGDTVVSGTSAELLSQSSVTDNGSAHKIVVRAKNTVADSIAQLQVYIGANNHATYNLTNDFADYEYHGIQQDDEGIHVYNANSADMTIDSVKVYQYDGNVGLLV